MKRRRYAYYAWYGAGTPITGRGFTSLRQSELGRAAVGVWVVHDTHTDLWLVVPPGGQGDVETYPDRDTAYAAAMHR